MKFLLIIHFKNVLKNCLNLYTRKPLKEVIAMKKEHLQTQPNQAQPNQTQQEAQGGEAMIYFVTFPYKVDKEKAKEIIVELRKRFPLKTPIFAPRPPSGKRMIIEIAGSLVIITFPYKKNPNLNTQQASQSPMQGGFTLGELIKSKKT